MKKPKVSKGTENYIINVKPDRSDTIKVLNQTGKVISIPRDLGRGAKLPGKRVSRTGKVYWETRFNRSDSANQKF